MNEQMISTASGIVSAFVSHNSVRPEDFVGLINDVHRKLISIAEGLASEPVEKKPTPLMPWKKTIHHKYLISLEDGKQYKTLRRHLTGLGMTPEDYQAKWDLPRDYPLVCKDYSERRSTMAKSIGLGRKPKDEPETVSQPEPKLEEPKTAPPKAEATKAEKKVTPILKPKDRPARPKKGKAASE